MAATRMAATIIITIMATTIIPASITAGTAMRIDAQAMLRLQSWLSPSFPIGAYSYSHALEYAVEAGLVSDRDTLVDWLDADLRHGAGRTDAILFAVAWQAVQDWQNPELLIEVAELAAALRGTAELALESNVQGRAFAATVQKVWPHQRLEPAFAELQRRDIALTLPVAVAVTCAAHAIALQPALLLYLQSAVASLVSAGVRLIPLGQTDGQLAAAALEAAVDQTVSQAMTTELDDIGSAALMVDWASLQHETQYTRLFRS